MYRISRHSQVVKGVQFGDFRIGSLLFASDVVLFAPLVCDRFAAECEAAGILDPAPSGGV